MPYKGPVPNSIITTALVTIAIGSYGNVHAFGPLGADVDDICASAGNALLPEFQP